MAGSVRLESVAGFAWNRWQLCRGISGRLAVESVAAFARNTHKPLDRHVLAARIAALLRVKARHDAGHDRTIQLEQQAAQLEAWGRALEGQLQDHVIDLERMGLLKRFLSPEVVQAAITLGDGSGWRAGRKEVAVLSCVLHGFETIVERTEPTEVFEMLRDYHQALAPFINTSEATLARFDSDELQLIFDASSCRHPAEQAVRMAVSMRGPLVSQCEKWRSSRYALDVGVGIAHGEAACGLIELGSRLNYTVLGAARRLASRLGAAGQGANILISQPVWEQVGKRFRADPAGQLVVQGYAEPIPFFVVTGEVENSL